MQVATAIPHQNLNRCWLHTSELQKKITAATVTVIWCLKDPRKLVDALLRDIDVESMSLTSSKYEMRGWALPSFRLCRILQRRWWEVRVWWCFSIFMTLCAGLTQPLEGLGIMKRYQLAQGHYLDEGSWGAAPPNVAVQHCLCEGQWKGQVRDWVRSREPNQKKFFANWLASWLLCQSTCTVHVLKNVAALFTLLKNKQTNQSHKQKPQENLD